MGETLELYVNEQAESIVRGEHIHCMRVVMRIRFVYVICNVLT